MVSTNLILLATTFIFLPNPVLAMDPPAEDGQSHINLKKISESSAYSDLYQKIDEAKIKSKVLRIKFSEIELFRNSLCYPKTVMLNLFQHLKEIPKQVRDDSEVKAILRFERSPIENQIEETSNIPILDMDIDKMQKQKKKKKFRDSMTLI